MRIIVLFLSMVLVQVLTTFSSYGQCYDQTCPTPSYLTSPGVYDFSNWDWTNQDPCNWIAYNNELRVCINPPFSSSTLFHGDLMFRIRRDQDYTNTNPSHLLQADKGWELLAINFATDRPYFILYNKYRSIVRPFIYVNNIPGIVSRFMISFQYSNGHLGSLGTINDPLLALDQYTNKPYSDVLLAYLDDASDKSWVCADFNVLFDPNTMTSDAYMSVNLVGIEQFNITLSGTLTPLSELELSSSSEHASLGETLEAKNIKLRETFEKGEHFMDSVSSYSTKLQNNLHPNAPQFLINHASKIKDISENIGKILGTALTITEGVGAALGIFNFIAGFAPSKNESAMQGATTSYEMELSGNMTLHSTSLGGNDGIKIPGTSSGSTNLYDCPMGFVNLKETPTLYRSETYDRRGAKHYVSDPLIATQGYMGKFIKYRLMEDIKVVANQTPNIVLKDVKAAFKFQATDYIGGNYYPLTNPIITTNTYRPSTSGSNCTGCTYDPNPYSVNVNNYVYRDLQNETFLIHKYIEEDHLDGGGNHMKVERSIYGTHYQSLDCIKNITFELPEYTDIKLSVQSLYQNTITHETYVFENEYAVDYFTPSNCTSTILYDNASATAEYWCYLYSEYYQNPYLTTLTSTTSSAYAGQQIAMLAGFISGTGFNAVGATSPICYGSNEPVDPASGLHVDVRQSSGSCGKSQGQRTAAFESTDESATTTEAYTIYPNPSTGIINVDLNNNTTAEVHVYNDQGHEVLFDQTTSGKSMELNLNNQPEGLYMIRVEGGDKLVTKKILLTK